MHILLGGKATKEAGEARVLYKAVPLTNAKYIVKNIMNMYKSEKELNESFEFFYERKLKDIGNEELVSKIKAYE